MTMIDARHLAINKIDIPAIQSAGGSHEHYLRSASRHPRRLGAVREHHHHVVGM
jgi:hypothetical protein